MKKRGVDDLLDLALNCQKKVFCGKTVKFRIIISMIRKMKCVKGNFDPRFCEKDCKSFDYRDDPRCPPECEGKDKDEDICKKCKDYSLQERFTKLDCCKEELQNELQETEPEKEIRFMALIDCCKKSEIKTEFADQCDCKNFLENFKDQDQSVIDNCCEDKKFKYTEKCNHC